MLRTETTYQPELKATILEHLFVERLSLFWRIVKRILLDIVVLKASKSRQTLLEDFLVFALLSPVLLLLRQRLLLHGKTKIRRPNELRDTSSLL